MVAKKKKKHKTKPKYFTNKQKGANSIEICKLVIPIKPAIRWQKLHFRQVHILRPHYIMAYKYYKVGNFCWAIQHLWTHQHPQIQFAVWLICNTPNSSTAPERS